MWPIPSSRAAPSPDPAPDPSSEGLPAGVPSPPDSGISGVRAQLSNDVEEGSRLGIPRPGTPLRPLPSEEAAQEAHDQAQHRITHWSEQVHNLVPALKDAAGQVVSDIADKLDTVTEEIHACKENSSVLLAELTEPDRKYRSALTPAVLRWLSIGIVLVASVEVLVQRPMVGRVMDIDPASAWGMATFIVIATTGISYLAGWTGARWSGFEGPRRQRRIYAAGTVAAGAVAFAFLPAVVSVRLSMTKLDDPWIAVLLFTAMQAAVQIAAALDGWWRGDPRVREIRQMEKQLVTLTAEQSGLRDQLDTAQAHESEITGFDLDDWVHHHRNTIASEYRQAVLDVSRRDREIRLLDPENNHAHAASLLLRLPMPEFIPPVVVADLDSDDDWITGGILTL